MVCYFAAFFVAIISQSAYSYFIEELTANENGNENQLT